MNWERAKNILILFFLAIDICLCVILVQIRTNRSAISANTVRQTVELLEQHQIHVSDDVIPKKKFKNRNYHLAALMFENRDNLNKWLGSGYGIVKQNLAAHQYSYSNQNKQLVIDKTSISFTVNKNPVLLTERDQKEIKEHLSAKLKKMGFSEKNYYFSSAWFDNGLYRAVISPMAEYVKVAGVELNITADKEELIQISGNWFQFSGKESFAEDGLLDVTSVLANLIYLQKSEPLEITEISLAAYVPPDYLDNKIITAAPVYVFVCRDAAEYYFDARTGEQIVRS